MLNRSVAVSIVLFALTVLCAVFAIAQQPVVVELFTSEGCSSCPPADAMLTKLSHQRNTNIANLILLEEHVEYWNDGGWHDRFSGPTYTQRQYDYVKDLHLATAYTPQIVIDGHLQASGNNPAQVQQFLLQAAKASKPATVTLHFAAPDKLQVTVDNPSRARMEILVAVTEDDLTTKVGAGENGGKTLMHSAVVRELHKVGSTSDDRFDKVIKLPDKSDWKKPDLRAIVLVQNPSSGEVLGAAQLPYAAPVPTTGGR
jgi:hypothetical protein